MCSHSKWLLLMKAAANERCMLLMKGVHFFHSEKPDKAIQLIF